MTAQGDFWSWFVEHERELFDFDPAEEVEMERIFDPLAAQLARIDKDLSFEFGPNGWWRTLSGTSEPVTPEFVESSTRIGRVLHPFTPFVKGARGNVAHGRLDLSSTVGFGVEGFFSTE